MELIDGKPLTQYAEEHKLDIRRRLELMIKVCEAVQHAHERGIIHRDLKPGNILVDEKGQPKILDFGLARATDFDAQMTQQTVAGQILGTLDYMSPEQVLGDPLALDTRSDIYALGVILYELLAHKLPYTLSNLLHEAVQTILVTEPVELSSIDRTFSGDVEIIVGKALEKDKARRYSSAAELAADIVRFLRNEPIVARPPSVTYRISKFARRHKMLVASATIICTVLVLGAAVSTWQAIKARRAQNEAEKQAAIAKAVNNFLQQDLLGQANPWGQHDPDPNLTVRTALDRAAQNLGGRFKDQPEVEAAIRETIGWTYGSLGSYPQEHRELEQALQLSSRARGPRDPRTLAILDHLAVSEDDLGHYAEAERLETEALDGDRRVLSVHNQQTWKAMLSLAWIQFQEGKYSASEALYQQVIDLDHEEEDRDRQSSMINLARVYLDDGKYAQSEALLRPVLATLQRSSAPEMMVLRAKGNLAWVLDKEKKYQEAEDMERQVIEAYTRILGPETRPTLTSMTQLDIFFVDEGKYAQAEELGRQLVDVKRRVLGPEFPDTLSVVHNLGYIYFTEGKYKEARPLLMQAVELRLKTVGAANPATVNAIGDMAELYSAEGQYSSEFALLRKAAADAPLRAEYLNMLAWGLLSARDVRERRPQEALQVARKLFEVNPDDPDAANTLGLAELRNERWDEAIATLNRAVKGHNGSDPTDFLFLAMSQQGRGNNTEAEKDYARGTELAVKAVGNPDLPTLWSEAAAALGKPSPPKPVNALVSARR